jgi:hypothetical protein
MLRSLIYPLTEVILGFGSFPFRRGTCLCVALCACCSSLLLPLKCLSDDIFAVGLFGWKEWHLKAQENKGGSTRALPLSHLILKLPKDDTLRTHEQLSRHGDVFKLFNAIVNIAFLLVLEYSGTDRSVLT